MADRRSLDAAALLAGWRVLRRHLRYAGANPRKLLWIVRRALDLVRTGRLRGVLQRHRVAGDLRRQYNAWQEVERQRAETRIALYREQRSGWTRQPRFSVLMPLYCPPLPLLEQAIASVTAQAYGEWELCMVDDGSRTAAHVARIAELCAHEPRIRFVRRTQNGGIAVATNDAIALATGDYCVFLDQDDVLAREALFEFAARVVAGPPARVLYADEDRIDVNGQRSQPVFKPEYDPEWLRTTNYILHPVAMETRLLRALGGLRTGVDGVQDWDLLLRASEIVERQEVAHIAHVLYHWREHRGSTAAAVYEKSHIVTAQERVLADAITRRGEHATIEQAAGSWRIRYALPDPPPLVSIVVPTRDRANLLAGCVDGLRTRTAYSRWEAVIVDNASSDPAALSLLDALRRDPRFIVLRDESAFNYSALCNAGVRAARGEIVVLMNNDVEPIKSDWLTELVSHALRPGVGLVGAMLYYPDDTIQHAGVVLGLNGIADRPYIGYPRGFQGVDSRLLSVHTITAMITACAALRRTVYEAVGGMDEQLPIGCNDLDLCLRVADLGLHNILTPHAELYHHESASRGYHYHTAFSMQETADEARFRAKWGARLDFDPSYNPNLVRNGSAYALEVVEEGRAP